MKTIRFPLRKRSSLLHDSRRRIWCTCFHRHAEELCLLSRSFSAVELSCLYGIPAACLEKHFHGLGLLPRRRTSCLRRLP